LNTPISLNELKDALTLMKRGKSPGWDGISSEFYLSFWDQRGQPLFNMIHHSIRVGFFNNSRSQEECYVLFRECTSLPSSKEITSH